MRSRSDWGDRSDQGESVSEQTNFQVDQPSEKLRAVKRDEGIICSDLLLAAETSRKIYFLAIRPDEGCRDAV